MVRSTTRQPAFAPRARLGVAALVGLVITALPIAGAAQAATTPPAVTVKDGDTLWGLARQYLSDPFLWPEIYRLNTLVVEDPHWIYPGEVLRLASSDAVSAVPTVDTPLAAEAPAMQDSVSPAAVKAQAPAPAAEPPVPAHDSVDMSALLSQNHRNQLMRETLRAYSEQPYRPLRRSEFYSSGFLTEGHDLPFGRLTGKVTPPQIGVITSEVSVLLYSDVTLAPPSGGSYQVGDSLLIVTLGDEITSFGDEVLPTGIVRVTDVSNGQYVGSVVALYGRIQSGQRLLPAEHFSDGGSVRAVAVADGVQARLLGAPNNKSLKKPQDVLFLDKGRKDGVAPGDVFELRRTRTASGGRAVPEVMATVQVVHVNDRSATTRILTLTAPNLPIGTEARQIAKLPS
jgi:LysM repeat protein